MTFRIPAQQYSFTSGMLDDSLQARSDIRAYYAGAREITNMLALPQGGVSMRGGLAFVDEIPSAANGVRMAAFEFSTEQKYLILFTDRQLHIYREGRKQITIATPYTRRDLSALDWTQSLDTMILVHPDYQPRKLMRQGRHDAWSLETLRLSPIPQHDFDGGGSRGSEAVWSPRRGWPRSVYLFEGRLYFGGSRSRPQTVWGSQSNDFFSFRTSEDSFDDEAVEASLDGDRVSAIEQLYALNDFFVFTSGGLFVNPESPTTPNNFYFTRHSELPAANIRPVELDGSIMFIRHGKDGHHQSLHELVYDDAKQIYTTQDLALLAESLMRSPVAIAARLGNESDSANHLFVVNGRDGSVAVLNTRKSQQITGWTLLKTQGKFMDAVVIGNLVYFLVQRSINGQERYFIEQLDSLYRFDAAVKYRQTTARSDWSGLGHLEAEEVALYADGVYLGPARVENGQITTPFPVNEIEIGLVFDWAVETMPIEAQLANGTLIGERHRIVKATLHVKDTQAMNVNGHPVAFRNFADMTLDEPPRPFSGLKTIRFLGWSGGREGNGATIRITGQSTGSATILSLSAEVAQ